MKIVVRLLAAVLLVASTVGPASVTAAERPRSRGLLSESQDLSAQRNLRRPRTVIRVYPRPLYRECRVRYVREWRVSGPVVVPAMRCWWAPI